MRTSNIGFAQSSTALAHGAATFPKMTSREIASLIGFRHDNVLRTARILVERGVTQSEETQFVDPQNHQCYPVHELSKRDSLVLVARLSPEFTGRIVDRWMELEEQTSSTDLSNPAVVRDLLLAYTERVIALETTIKADASKVEFAETICNTAGVCKMGQFAKTIGWGPNRFIDRLRTDEVLMQNNVPFQTYIDRGYFRVVEKKPWTDSSGNEHPTFTTMVTGRGQEWLAKRYTNRADQMRSGVL